jgi:ABC-type thiamine transport system ATPase subunit
MIFQQFNLFDSRTVAGNVAYPLEVAAGRGRDPPRVAELLDFVGLADKARLPEQLGRAEATRRHRPRTRDEPAHPPRRRGHERPRPRHHAEVLSVSCGAST